MADDNLRLDCCETNGKQNEFPEEKSGKELRRVHKNTGQE